MGKASKATATEHVAVPGFEGHYTETDGYTIGFESCSSLGAALAHAAGRDEEAAALHEAVAIALRAGRPQLAAAARRELAWIDVLRARYTRALTQIEAARRTGGEDVFLTGLAGACAYQLGRYREGLALLGQAAQRAEEVGDRRTLVLAVGEIGLINVMVEDRRAARESLKRARRRPGGSPGTRTCRTPRRSPG